MKHLDIEAAIQRKKEELEQLEAELNELNEELDEVESNYNSPWPKTLDVYVHNGKWDENVMDWAADNGLKKGRDDNALQSLAYIAYETKLTYLVEKDGTFKLVGCDGRTLGNNL